VLMNGKAKTACKFISKMPLSLMSKGLRRQAL
jgi:hypothetical protein